MITSWIRTTTTSGGQLQVAAIDESSLAGGAWSKPVLPCAFEPGCTNNADDTSGDPMLAGNPDPTGINPKYVYLVGTSTRPSHNYDNQISVWSTSDGGTNWLKRAAVDYQSDANTWQIDKPSIAADVLPENRATMKVSSG